MDPGPENPFADLDSALEYTKLLLEEAREARDYIEVEIERVADPKLERRKQALQLVSHKLDSLSLYLDKSHRTLSDLRSLRRLLLEERKATETVR